MLFLLYLASSKMPVVAGFAFVSYAFGVQIGGAGYRNSVEERRDGESSSGQQRRSIAMRRDEDDDVSVVRDALAFASRHRAVCVRKVRASSVSPSSSRAGALLRYPGFIVLTGIVNTIVLETLFPYALVWRRFL